MKELSIEEKAKAYDEAIEKARKLVANLPNGRDDRLYHVWDLESIFPELKEIEDKRIRKEIIELVMQPTWKTEKEFRRRNELCAWLEKQHNPKTEQHSLPVSDDSSLPTLDESTYHPCTEEAYEQKSTEWSEWDRILQDSSISYLCNLRDTFETKGWDKEQIQKCINWLKSLKDRLQPQSTWKPSGEQMEYLAKAIVTSW